MGKKKQVPSSVSGDVMKTNLEAIYTASLIAKQNAIVISPPGFGKTKMSYHMGRQVSNGHTVFLDLSPSTPPERISGPVDIAALKEGRMEFNVKNTPYDPEAQIVIADELWRANEIVFDMLIHATNDVTRTDAPVFWGTSNFVVKSSRTEALRDRFALWYYYQPGRVNVAEVVDSPDISTWTFDLPVYKDALDVRNAPYTDEARKAIVSAIENLVDAIGNGKFVINHRRIEAWRELLFRSTVYQTGNNSFKSVPDEALKILRYAYPASDETEMRLWESVAVSVIDAVGVAIEQFMGIARGKFDMVIKSQNPNERSAFMSELGQALANSEEELRRIGGDDKRVDEAIVTFNTWFRQAAQGKKLS